MFQFHRIVNSAGVAFSAIIALAFGFVHPQEAFAQGFKYPGCKPPQSRANGGGTIWNAPTSQPVPWGVNIQPGSIYLPNPCPSILASAPQLRVYTSRPYRTSPYYPSNLSYSTYPSYTAYRAPERFAPPKWHEDLSGEELRAKTIWSGADREDRKMQSEIVEKQLRDGPESPDAIRLAWSRAQYFISAQKPTLAEPLLKELIVTLESHAPTSENRQILALARAKLNKLQSIKERIENPSYARRGSAFRFSRGF